MLFSEFRTDENGSKPLLRVIAEKAFIYLTIFQLIASSTALCVGYGYLNQRLGAENYPDIIRWLVVPGIIFFGAAVLSLFVGLISFWIGSVKVTDPLSKIAKTAAILTRTRGTTRFATDSKIIEVDQIVTAYNRLYEAQENQINELFQLIESLMHDIRTPLTHITCLAEDVKQRRGDPVASADLMQDGCRIISSMIEDHMIIAMNDKSKDRAPWVSVNFSEVVSQGCELYSAIARHKSIELEYTLPESPITINGHLPKFQRLFTNLLSNALKYTPRGGKVTVTATVIQSTQLDKASSPETLAKAPSYLRFSVADTGIGIPKNDQPHIFDLHYRGDKGRSEQGSGLGLSMVKAIVQFYGGMLDFQTSDNAGSTFTATIPMLPLPESPQGNAEVKAKPDSGNRPGMGD